MDWPTRLKIALGSAKGLAYLHEDCKSITISRSASLSIFLSLGVISVRYMQATHELSTEILKRQIFCLTTVSKLWYSGNIAFIFLDITVSADELCLIIIIYNRWQILDWPSYLQTTILMYRLVSWEHLGKIFELRFSVYDLPYHQIRIKFDRHKLICDYH